MANAGLAEVRLASESGGIADIGGRLKSALTGREESQQIAVPRAGLP